ncbi:MAG: DUF448 domain-containing protein [Deltaproteobacteria bacterium]|nr:DUF448 domain-containing protein [Deltaproteobacteria bacterium]
MSRKRATPIRMCVGCGGRDTQSQLLRFAVGGGSTLVPGPGNGRGGYLHPRRGCVQAFATSRSGLVRSLGVVVSREMRARYAALLEHGAALLP